VVTPWVEQQIMERCVMPTVRGMAAEGKPYKGVLFAGLMIDNDKPEDQRVKLLEYNVRFGDPECQVLMARLKSDLVELLLAAAEGKLAGKTLEWSEDPALVVVMAAKGYPGSYEKNTVIEGLDEAGQIEGVTVLHAGTKSDDQGRILATGGRVLGVTATGKTVREAQMRAYQAVDRIRWPQGFCRRDIAWRALK
jgi:phosphoribosylamine--glycine ligase